MSFDVFISYSSKDRALVEAIAKRLELDFLVWWDQDLISGTSYENHIITTLSQAKLVLVAWTENASTSEWVDREIRISLTNSRLIPIILDGTPLNANIAHLDAVDLRNWNGKDDHPEFAQLVRDVRLHVASSKLTTSNEVASAPDISAKTAIASATLIDYLLGLPLVGFLISISLMMVLLFAFQDWVGFTTALLTLASALLCFHQFGLRFGLIRYSPSRKLSRLLEGGECWFLVFLFDSSVCINDTAGRTCKCSQLRERTAGVPNAVISVLGCCSKGVLRDC